MAVILDSMVFLTVAALVSVSMLAAISPTHHVVGPDLQDYVESLNTALLRTTVEIIDEEGTCRISVSDLTVIYLLTLAQGGDLTYLDKPIESVSNMLECMVPPGAEFRWTADAPPYSLCLGEIPPTPKSKWVAVRTSAMPILGGQLEMRLEICY